VTTGADRTGSIVAKCPARPRPRRLSWLRRRFGSPSETELAVTRRAVEVVLTWLKSVRRSWAQVMAARAWRRSIGSGKLGRSRPSEQTVAAHRVGCISRHISGPQQGRGAHPDHDRPVNPTCPGRSDRLAPAPHGRITHSDPYPSAVVLTSSADRLSLSIGGLGGHLASRCGPLLQRVCNTVDVADIDEGRLGARNSARTTASTSAARTASESGQGSSWCCTFVARSPI
jgi:hypothetical protein